MNCCQLSAGRRLWIKTAIIDTLLAYILACQGLGFRGRQGDDRVPVHPHGPGHEHAIPHGPGDGDFFFTDRITEKSEAGGVIRQYSTTRSSFSTLQTRPFQAVW
jgi:hypothetical protein